MNRLELDKLTGEDLRRMIDPDIEEYEDFYPEVKDIESAWKLVDKEQDLYKTKWENDILTLEREELSREERRNFELDQEASCVFQYHQYHHEEYKQPCWKQCVDNITKLLNN